MSDSFSTNNTEATATWLGILAFQTGTQPAGSTGNFIWSDSVGGEFSSDPIDYFEFDPHLLASFDIDLTTSFSGPGLSSFIISSGDPDVSTNFRPAIYLDYQDEANSDVNKNAATAFAQGFFSLGWQVVLDGMLIESFTGSTPSGTYFESPTWTITEPQSNTDEVIFQVTSGFDADTDYTLYISPVNGVNPDDTDGGSGSTVGGSTGEVLTGSTGDDTIIGNGGSDTVNAGEGNDVVYAGSGDNAGDSLSGGNGNDILGGGPGNDTIIGGNGSDVFYGGTGNDLISDSGTDTASNTAWAGTGDDTVTGGAGSDILGGGPGSDVINGGNGNDLIYGGRNDGLSTNDDTISGGDGRDTVYAGAGDDEVYGGSGDDLIFNGSGNDTVYGGADGDEIWGGGGNDLLYGGTGDDTFGFVAGTGEDTIADFETLDRIDLSGTNTNFTSLDQVKAASVPSDFVGGPLLINLGGGDTLLLIGVDIDSLTVGDFIF